MERVRLDEVLLKNECTKAAILCFCSSKFNIIFWISGSVWIDIAKI